VASVRLRRFLAARTSAARFWRRGVAHEVAWWEAWIASGGKRWPEEFRERLDPEAPLREPLLLELLPSLPDDPVRVLDVGAGPITSLGRAAPGRRVEVTAVDPLADDYARLWAEAGIEPPVRTERCAGEELVARFGRGRFDVAYARNALDHTVDPPAVVRQMLDVVRPGGYVVLRHSRDEGEKARYEGLHQWNLRLEEDRLVIARPGRVESLTEGLPETVSADCRRDGETIICVLRQAG
jgi:SAM-dependent methyltransferase